MHSIYMYMDKMEPPFNRSIPTRRLLRCMMVLSTCVMRVMTHLQVVLEVAKLLLAILGMDVLQIAREHPFFLPLHLSLAHGVVPGGSLWDVQHRSRPIDVIHSDLFYLCKRAVTMAHNTELCRHIALLPAPLVTRERNLKTQRNLQTHSYAKRSTVPTDKSGLIGSLLASAFRLSNSSLDSRSN